MSGFTATTAIPGLACTIGLGRPTLPTPTGSVSRTRWRSARAETSAPTVERLKPLRRVSSERESGPLHQQLGSDSSGLAEAKADSLKADVLAGRELAHSTDYVR